MELVLDPPQVRVEVGARRDADQALDPLQLGELLRCLGERLHQPLKGAGHGIAESRGIERDPLWFLYFIPLVFGILLTFRLAGPIYRFEQYLRSVARGEQIGPCKIRKGDELQFLCDAINDATEPLRMERVTPQEAAADGKQDEQALPEAG